MINKTSKILSRNCPGQITRSILGFESLVIFQFLWKWFQAAFFINSKNIVPTVVVICGCMYLKDMLFFPQQWEILHIIQNDACPKLVCRIIDGLMGMEIYHKTGYHSIVAVAVTYLIHRTWDMNHGLTKWPGFHKFSSWNGYQNRINL